MLPLTRGLSAPDPGVLRPWAGASASEARPAASEARPAASGTATGGARSWARHAHTAEPSRSAPRRPRGGRGALREYYAAPAACSRTVTRPPLIVATLGARRASTES